MDKKELYQDTSYLVKAANEIYDRAYSDYSEMVSNAMKGTPTQKQAEHILDGMLDFCYDERFQILYRQFCKYIYRLYPEVAVDYVRIFRDQIGEDDNNEHDDNNNYSSN